ncbi:hypothetical protein H2248_011865 [Termitomyces sp. 'cryptogamus']|nr:hypothetical protein H2248_011865 [Termitomyces sp. 'cryptogamus']
MDDWAHRIHIPLTTAAALNSIYSRAHAWFEALKLTLVREHKWSEVPTADHRLLFSLETSSIRRSSTGIAAGPKLRLQLPIQASSFFSPERRVQWQMVFHSDIFDTLRKMCPPVRDILNLLQCLLTGLLTISFEERLPDATYRTIRGLPPLEWMIQNKKELTKIFGHEHYQALARASGDTKTSFKLESVPH